MNGLLEWTLYTAAMVLAGVALLAFFISPLLCLLAVAAVGLVSWVSASPVRDRDSRGTHT